MTVMNPFGVSRLSTFWGFWGSICNTLLQSQPVRIGARLGTRGEEVWSARDTLLHSQYSTRVEVVHLLRGLGFGVVHLRRNPQNPEGVMTVMMGPLTL